MTENSSTLDSKEFNLTRLENEQPERMLGYTVTSTAPINVEDPPSPVTAVAPEIHRVACFLVNSPSPELVVSIHGYATKRIDATIRYKDIYDNAVKACQPRNHVFFGYLWPSEDPKGDPTIPNDNKLKQAINCLPIAPFNFLITGLVLSVTALVLLLQTSELNLFLVPLLFLGTLILSALLTIILLRLSNYFRDNYRATNYGVLDLVELLRQVDQAAYTAFFVKQLDTYPDVLRDLTQKAGITMEQWDVANFETRIGYWKDIKDEDWKIKSLSEKEDDIDKQLKKIKLSFIGHSMGCFVVTNTIRILSDVFDQRAIKGKPTPQIGRVFCLERLILVAPDIPVETIMPRRANFLRSSLSRCEESYVFSNEGDLALRLASTIANYISFPAKTRRSGYRLGNITVKRCENQEYGIVNLHESAVESPFDYLEIRASDWEHYALKEMRAPETIKKVQIQSTGPSFLVSDVFTYFDCTDYRDFLDTQSDSASTARYKGKEEGVVSFAERKAALNFTDYIRLCFAYFLNKPRYINTHGGYFDGKFSKQAIYQIAFNGFNEFLKSFYSDEKYKNIPFEQIPSKYRLSLLCSLSEDCKNKGIKLLLSPNYYKKNIQDN